MREALRHVLTSNRGQAITLGDVNIKKYIHYRYRMSGSLGDVSLECYRWVVYSEGDYTHNYDLHYQANYLIGTFQDTGMLVQVCTLAFTKHYIYSKLCMYMD